MANTGQVDIDFGSFPGTDRATAVVTGQAAITGASFIEAWIGPRTIVGAGGRHEDESTMLATFVTVTVPESTRVAGTGFTIVAQCHEGFLFGKVPVNWVWV